MNRPLAILGCVCGLSSGVLAGTIDPAFQIPVGGLTAVDYGANDPVNLGMVFTPTTTSIYVDALGFYADPNLTADETVAIYDSSGHLVVQTSVSHSGPITDSYYWQSITPILLTGGETYTVDAFVGDNPWAYSSGNPTVNAEITYNNHTFDYVNAVVYPTQSGANAAYYGPNFSIGSDSVPDGGSTLAMMGTVMSGLFLLRRKH